MLWAMYRYVSFRYRSARGIRDIYVASAVYRPSILQTATLKGRGVRALEERKRIRRMGNGGKQGRSSPKGVGRDGRDQEETAPRDWLPYAMAEITAGCGR